jgi:2-polyprenyl-6-hydroxyphenyl methylase / 3-demethylubiquinone-9 3-methyltransferase
MSSSISAAEIARFDALGARWWDARGPMRPLHRMNPVRIRWIDDRIRQRFGPAPVCVLDVGCGGGLAAEALARRGLDVLGLDAAPEAIAAARRHAEGQGLRLAYRVGAPESLLDEARQFPVVLALEVIEHVPDRRAFLGTLGRLTEPGGLLFVATLNRTVCALLTAKIGAEYVLRWLPRGTHEWRNFVTPAELSAAVRMAGLRVADITGLGFDPLTGRWRTGRTLAVNYMLMAERPR